MHACVRACVYITIYHNICTTIVYVHVQFTDFAINLTVYEMFTVYEIFTVYEMFTVCGMFTVYEIFTELLVLS